MDGFEQIHERLNQVADDLAFVRGQLADLPEWRKLIEARLQSLERHQAYQKGVVAVIAGGISLLVSSAAAFFRWHR